MHRDKTKKPLPYFVCSFPLPFHSIRSIPPNRLPSHHCQGNHACKKCGHYFISLEEAECDHEIVGRDLNPEEQHLKNGTETQIANAISKLRAKPPHQVPCNLTSKKVLFLGGL